MHIGFKIHLNFIQKFNKIYHCVAQLLGKMILSSNQTAAYLLVMVF